MAQLDPTLRPTVLQGSAATARLLQLGIATTRLFAALDAGDVAARQADEFSPATAAGSLRWLETVRMLRQGLFTDGWRLNDDRNSPRVIDPGQRLAVVPVSGSADTGLAEGTPRTKNPRGDASSRAVQINGQLEFGYVEALLADMGAEKTAAVATYFLLILLPPRTFGAAEVLPRDAGGDDDVDFDIAAR